MRLSHVASLLSFLGLVAAFAVGAERARLPDNPYSNDNIHEWACETVHQWAMNHTDRADPQAGCYDICESLSFKQQITGKAKDSDGKEYNSHGLTAGQWVPMGLGDEFWDGEEGYGVANACAITLTGAEW